MSGIEPAPAVMPVPAPAPQAYVHAPYNGKSDDQPGANDGLRNRSNNLEVDPGLAGQQPRASMQSTRPSFQIRSRSQEERKFPPRRTASRTIPIPVTMENIQELKEYTPRDIRAHFVAMSGEFVGTFLFLWFALAGTSYAANQPTTVSSSLAVTYYSSTMFGMSLLASVWVFYRISGGLFNPAVTLGLVVSGQLPIVRGLLLFPSQVLASICASALVQAMFPGPLSALTRLVGGTSVVQGVFIEAFLTAMLVISVLMLAAEKSKDTFLAPVGIGLAFFAAELVGIPFTGGSLNPVRSFGPDVATRNFPGYHWIYWVGPFLGALLAAGYYRFAKFLNYHEANPGQDAAHPNEDHWDPEEEDV